MTFKRTSFTLRLILTAAFAAILPAMLPAQIPPLVTSEDPNARALNDNLKILALDARNVRALIGAGEAALALGDPDAALGFFGRAVDVDPRDGRIKAGLARAFVLLEKPRDALKLFDSAVELGFPEADITSDRGLAYDLRGDQKRAQADYAVALRRNPHDAELLCRYALSLAISGNKDAALEMLTPLLHKKDKAAWRARAFVLAMNGDVDGANGIARAVMPASLAQPMAIFFTRLVTLNAGQKAAAVNFGSIPNDGKTTGPLFAYDDPDIPADVLASAQAGGGLIPSGTPFGKKQGDAAETPHVVGVSREQRRRPGASDPVSTAMQAPVTEASIPPTSSRTMTERVGKRIGPVDPAVIAAVTQSVQATSASGKHLVVTTGALPPPSAAPVDTNSSPGTAANAVPADDALAAIVGGLELEKTQEVALPVIETPAVKPAIATISAPDPAKLAAEKKAAAKKVADKKAADKKAAEKKAADKKAAEQKAIEKANPVRFWAQVATGADKSALARDLGKMIKKSPATFKGMSGWTVTFKASRRLLIGPFPSLKKAQDFVAKAKTAGISGYAWTSELGQEIEKLPAK